MIEFGKFINADPAALPNETEFRHCNFSRTSPDLSGAQATGVRLWPGDDTPRTFIDCNLQNCEVPPGSTVVRSPRGIIEFDVVLDEHVVVVDSTEVARRQRVGTRLHGYYDENDNIVYEPAPIEEIIE